jgi:hypothetical protein
VIGQSRDNELSIDRAPGLNLLRTGNRSRAENADGAVLNWAAKAAGGQSSFSGAMACSSPLWIRVWHWRLISPQCFAASLLPV